MEMEFFDLREQQALIKEDLNNRISNVLRHKKFILGPEIDEVESRLKSYVKVNNCITVGNGTDALQIALMSLGIKPGDEVITSCFSYISVPEVVSLLGAKPVYVDILEASFNIDHEAIEDKITSRTKCIIPVNLFGQCADYDEITSIAKKYNLPVIEDAAQSFGASYKTKKSGSFGKLACTSFFPSKPLGCYGDGGAIFTQDNQLADAVREIARHGQRAKYNHVRQGVNSRLDSIQGAILLAKLKVFDDELKKRDLLGNRYSKLLIDEGFEQVPKIMPDRTHVWAQYSIRVHNRDILRAKLHQKGIPTAVHYPMTLNQQPAFASEQYEYPVANKVAKEILSLPMSPYLKFSDQDKIVEKIIECSKFSIVNHA